jgi:cytochrome c biogenesis protein CcmG, thiol:disulfide interchange protein DsbE
MTARQQWTIVAAIVVALGGALYGATRIFGDQLFPVSVGSKAPSFSATTLDSVPRARTLADYHGQVVLLNICATWCLPCREEMPAIEQLHQAMGPKGLQVVSVSIDDRGTEPRIRAFAKEFGLTFPILHDATGTVSNVYQTTGVPETFIIARDGVIRKKIIGATDWNSESNRALIAQLLAEPEK